MRFLCSFRASGQKVISAIQKHRSAESDAPEEGLRVSESAGSKNILHLSTKVTAAHSPAVCSCAKEKRVWKSWKKSSSSCFVNTFFLLSLWPDPQDLNSIKNYTAGQAWWLTPIIPALWEAEGFEEKSASGNVNCSQIQPVHEVSEYAHTIEDKDNEVLEMSHMPESWNPSALASPYKNPAFNLLRLELEGAQKLVTQLTAIGGIIVAADLLH
uniref:uncharacterized protein LOC106993361 n=1 Tax=Macaca mulatta TaxID=9544 RepID=UPI0010A24122|nr:uncharacterized protein LOC106993361 [Macaca mulatta]